MTEIEQLYEQTAVLHKHLCPRQVLGVRMGLYAGELLGLNVPQSNKRLLIIVETDGCFADGVAVATNCWVGRRTMRVEDYGKVAGTFIDTRTEAAIRIFPSPQARLLAHEIVPEARNRWQAYLQGYQLLPAENLFSVQTVKLLTSVAAILSHAGKRVNCDHCGEEIINQREVEMAGVTVCLACANRPYYSVADDNAFLNHFGEGTDSSVAQHRL